MIETTIFGFLKPEDTDLADLKVFVGQNMDLIEIALSGLEATPNSHSHEIQEITNLESQLAGKYSTSGGEITGSVTITNAGDMVDLLHFNMDRGWKFKQKGALSSAELLLTSDTNSKRFRISSPLGVDSLEIRVDDTVGNGYIDSPLIKENGVPLIEKYSPKPVSVTALPNTTPTFVGQMAIDSVDGRTYIAEGATSTDWKRLATTSYVDVADNIIINNILYGLKFWNGTQAQYDLLTKDPKTVYYIVG